GSGHPVEPLCRAPLPGGRWGAAEAPALSPTRPPPPPRPPPAPVRVSEPFREAPAGREQGAGGPVVSAVSLVRSDVRGYTSRPWDGASSSPAAGSSTAPAPQPARAISSS